MTPIDRVSLRPEAGPSFARKAIRALSAAGLVAGVSYLGAQSPDPLAAAPERPAASEVGRGLAAGAEALAGERTYIVVLDHAALPEGWRDRPLEERTRLVAGYVSGRLAERGVAGIAPQYGQVLRGIAADGALPTARSVEMLQVAGPGGPGLAHLCVAIPADPASAEGMVSGMAGPVPALGAAAVPETQWRRFVAAHEVFHCLDFQERGVVWRQAQRFGMTDAPPAAPSEMERFADAAAAVWTFGSGPEAAGAVRAAADLRALLVARHLVEHRVLSFKHWTTPALDALADRLERGEGTGATGVAGAAALARTAVADVRGDGPGLLAALPRLNDAAERPTAVSLDQVGAELRRLGAPEALAARVELAVARQGGLDRLLPEPGSTGAGLLAMSAMAGDVPAPGRTDLRGAEGVGLAGADVRPLALPAGLSMDPATGLLVQAGDEALLRAVTAAQDRTLAEAADAGRAPIDPRSGLAMAAGADVATVRTVQAALAGKPAGLARDPATGLLLGEGDRAMLDAVQAARAAGSAPLERDAQTGLLAGPGDHAPLDAVTSAQDRGLAAAADAGRAPVDPRSGLVMAAGADVSTVRAVQAARAASAPSAPTDPRAQSATLRGLDLAGREGVLSARFQTWGMPMDPLAQEEMRIRHAFQQEMIRCNNLQAGANVMAGIFAGPTNGLSWSLGQLGAGMTAEMCRARAQQNAEAAMGQLRQIAQQRDLARQQQRMGARPGAWGSAPQQGWGPAPAPKQAWGQAGQDGGMKTPEPRRRPAQR